MGHAVPGMGHAVPGMGHAVPSMGHAVPSMGHAVPSMGRAVPSMGRAVPSMRHAVPGMGQAVPSMVHAVPGVGHAVPSVGQAVPGMGNSVPSTGNAVPRHVPAVPGRGYAVPRRVPAVPRCGRGCRSSQRYNLLTVARDLRDARRSSYWSPIAQRLTGCSSRAWNRLLIRRSRNSGPMRPRGGGATSRHVPSERLRGKKFGPSCFAAADGDATSSRAHWKLTKPHELGR